MLRALAAAVGVLLLAACGGGDHDSARSTISQGQIQQWAEELIASGGAIVQCPSGTNTGVIQKPAVSVGFDAGSDIPKEARAAVGARASEMLRDACDPTPR